MVMAEDREALLEGRGVDGSVGDDPWVAADGVHEQDGEQQGSTCCGARDDDASSRPVHDPSPLRSAARMSLAKTGHLVLQCVSRNVTTTTRPRRLRIRTTWPR